MRGNVTVDVVQLLLALRLHGDGYRNEIAIAACRELDILHVERAGVMLDKRASDVPEVLRIAPHHLDREGAGKLE